MKLIPSGDYVWRQLRAPAVLLMTALLIFGAVEAQDRTSDNGLTAKVLSLEQLWNQAEVGKDTHSLNQLLADTFIFVDIDGGLQNKTQFLASGNQRRRTGLP